jgi:hypothetical protein
MRKYLISIAALAALAALALVGANAAPRFTPTSGCNEASQMLSCLNQAVPGVSGAGSGTTSATVNANSGVVSFTGVTIAAVTSQALTINNSLVTGASQCVTTIVADSGSAAASFPYIRNTIPTAGVLTVNLSNAAAATATGAITMSIAFFCFQ